jgi:hypothetical protein
MLTTVYRLTVLWLLLGIMSGVSDAEDVARAVQFVEVSIAVALVVSGVMALIWVLYCHWDDDKDIDWLDLRHPERRRKDQKSRPSSPPGD